MAFQQSHHMSVTLVDKQNRSTTTHYDLWLPSTATTDAQKDAAARAQAEKIINFLGPATAGTIVSYSISSVHRQDTFALPTLEIPASESGSITVDVKDKAGKFANIRLPMPHPVTRVNGARGRLDVSSTELINFVSLFQDGTNQAATISDGETAGQNIVNAVTVTRTSRSG